MEYTVIKKDWSIEFETTSQQEIEDYIKALLAEEAAGVVEIQRNLLSEYFHCVPSQINYVISTRFNPDRGYVVTSRRGGGGYVTIRKIDDNSAVGDKISEYDAFAYIKKLYDCGTITAREGRIMQDAVSDMSLYRTPDKDSVRADVLKNLLKNIEK